MGCKDAHFFCESALPVEQIDPVSIKLTEESSATQTFTVKNDGNE